MTGVSLLVVQEANRSRVITVKSESLRNLFFFIFKKIVFQFSKKNQCTLVDVDYIVLFKWDTYNYKL